MKTKKILIIASAIAALMITGCFDTSRDNVFDPGGDNYDPSAASNSANNDMTNVVPGSVWKKVDGFPSDYDPVAVVHCKDHFVTVTNDGFVYLSSDGKVFNEHGELSPILHGGINWGAVGVVYSFEYNDLACGTDSDKVYIGGTVYGDTADAPIIVEYSISDFSWSVYNPTSNNYSPGWVPTRINSLSFDSGVIGMSDGSKDIFMSGTGGLTGGGWVTAGSFEWSAEMTMYSEIIAYDGMFVFAGDCNGSGIISASGFIGSDSSLQTTNENVGQPLNESYGYPADFGGVVALSYAPWLERVFGVTNMYNLFSINSDFYGSGISLHDYQFSFNTYVNSILSIEKHKILVAAGIQNVYVSKPLENYSDDIDWETKSLGGYYVDAAFSDADNVIVVVGTGEIYYSEN